MFILILQNSWVLVLRIVFMVIMSIKINVTFVIKIVQLVIILAFIVLVAYLIIICLQTIIVFYAHKIVKHV